MWGRKRVFANLEGLQPAIAIALYKARMWAQLRFFIFVSIRSTQDKKSRPVISILNYSKLRLLFRSTNKLTGGYVGVLFLLLTDATRMAERFRE